MCNCIIYNIVIYIQYMNHMVWVGHPLVGLEWKGEAGFLSPFEHRSSHPSKRRIGSGASGGLQLCGQEEQGADGVSECCREMAPANLTSDEE